jgi:hypothetical protein
VVLGYFTIFDLGLGRATTKYVADALAKDEGDQVVFAVPNLIPHADPILTPYLS